MSIPPATQYGLCPSHLHFCPNCYPQLSLGLPNHVFLQHPRFVWAQDLLCPRCNCLYTICLLCPTQRTQLKFKRMVSRHNRDFHDTTHVVPCALPPRIENMIDNISRIPVLGTTIPSPHNTPTPAPLNFQVPTTTTHPLVTFTSQRSTLYFQHHILDGSGPIYLTSKSIFHLDHNLTSLTTNDVSLNLLVGHLVLLLPDKPRKMLCQLIEAILQRTTAPPLLFDPSVLNSYLPRYHISNIPSNFPDLRRQFLKGNWAVFPNLPTPKLFINGLHAYCLPSDCLQHHLSFGYRVAEFSTNTTPAVYSHPTQSPRAIEISSGKNGIVPVAAIMWSDDCDPQNSKKNRKALWCLTITFIQDPSVITDSPLPTYAIAVGPKGTNHQNVFRIILNDMAKISNPLTPLRSYTSVGLPPK